MTTNIFDSSSLHLSAFADDGLGIDSNGAAGTFSRVLQFQKGESAQIRGVPDRESYLFLKQGALSVLEADGTQSRFRATDPKFNVFQMGPGDQVNGYALEDCVFFHVDSDALDGLVSWRQISGSLGEVADRKRLFLALECPVLRPLPLEVVYQLVSRMREQYFKAGEDVVREGEDGRCFYLIAKGAAEVWRREEFGDEVRLVATLGPGDGFGEEALVTGAQRNATVRMSEDGQLVVIDNEDFHELVVKPSVTEVKPVVALAMIREGYQLLDVRYGEEFEDCYLQGALLFPLNELHGRTDELSKDGKYLIYCSSGFRSRVAALLLSQHGIAASVIAGGVRNWPYEKMCL